MVYVSRLQDISMIQNKPFWLSKTDLATIPTSWALWLKVEGDVQ